MIGRYIRHLIYIILLVIADQYTKYLVVVNLKGSSPIELIPGVLEFKYLENDGAVFGLFPGNSTILIISSLVIMILVAYFYLILPDDKRYNVLKILLVLIMSGAIGNFIDRARLGYVIDFIYFSLINFPIFNLADSYITVSTALLILLGLFYYKDEDFEFMDTNKDK